MPTVPRSATAEASCSVTATAATKSRTDRIGKLKAATATCQRCDRAGQRDVASQAAAPVTATMARIDPTM